MSAFVFVRLDAQGNIEEVAPVPTGSGTWEQRAGDDPTVQRFYDPTYSFKGWLRERAQKDPALRVLVLWVAQIAGKTPAQALNELAAIAESILPDA